MNYIWSIKIDIVQKLQYPTLFPSFMEILLNRDTAASAKQFVKQQLDLKQKCLYFRSSKEYSPLYKRRHPVSYSTIQALASLSKEDNHFKSIDFFNCCLQDRDLKCLSSGQWAKLQNLNIGSNIFSSEGYKSLKLETWHTLVVLQMSDNKLNATACKILSQIQFKNINEIVLMRCQLNSDCIKQLSLNKWATLTALWLNHNLIDNTGLSYLAKCNWPLLKKLYLNHNTFTSDGLKYLVKGQWKQLTVLMAVSTYITDEGLKILAKAHWPCLQRFALSHASEWPFKNDKIIISSYGLNQFTKFNSPSLHLTVFVRKLKAVERILNTKTSDMLQECVLDGIRYF